MKQVYYFFYLSQFAFLLNSSDALILDYRIRPDDIEEPPKRVWREHIPWLPAIPAFAQYSKLK